MAGTATSRLIQRALSSIKTNAGQRESITNSVIFNPSRYFSVSRSRNMKFVQFTYADKPADIRVGYLEGDKVVDLNKADSSLSSTLLGVLRNGEVEKVQKLKSSSPAAIPISSVKLEAPIHGMDKVLCIGLNYKDHCMEQKLTPPPVPMFFSKFASCIIGPSDPVRLRTDVTKQVDWEVELAVVIGKKASNVKPDDAYKYVFGYTVAQDISARDWQKTMNGGQFLLGKAMDTFCPLGPHIVTADEVGDPQCLVIKCSVDGVLKQNSNTDQLIHKIPDAIARLSSVMTLLPGDVILTGTPGGVGQHRDPPEYLLPGTCLTSEIQNIGLLTTRVDKF